MRAGAAAILLVLLPCPAESPAQQDKSLDSGPRALAQDKGKKEAGVSYARQIVPIMKAQCEACHYPKNKKANLDLSTHAGILKGGKSPNNVVPGDPGKSLFVKKIVGKDPEMPKNANPLTPEQVELITRWVKEGARNN